VFKTKWLNEMFYRVFAFLSWNSYVHFKESHKRHHLYTYYKRYDWEQRSNPIPFTTLDVVSWFLFDYKKFKQLMWTNLNHAFGNTDVDFFFWCPLLSKDHIKTRKLVSWARVLLLGHLALVAVFIYFELYILIFLVTFSAFFATFLEHSTGIIQHMGLRGDVPDWRLNSYTVDFGPIMRFLYWNMNHHTEHHMYAAVPFYNLPKLRREIGWDLQKPLPGLIPALRHVNGVKRKQREDPEYRYMPEFPDSATPPPLPVGDNGRRS
jgi:fatty acid desaturase